jgi:hypothetical protein
MYSTQAWAAHYGLPLNTPEDFVQGYVDAMRLDAKGQGKPCGRGFIHRDKTCSDKSRKQLVADLKAGDAKAKARVARGKQNAMAQQTERRATEEQNGPEIYRKIQAKGREYYNHLKGGKKTLEAAMTGDREAVKQFDKRTKKGTAILEEREKLARTARHRAEAMRPSAEDSPAVRRKIKGIDRKMSKIRDEMKSAFNSGDDKKAAEASDRLNQLSKQRDKVLKKRNVRSNRTGRQYMEVAEEYARESFKTGGNAENGAEQSKRLKTMQRLERSKNRRRRPSK